LNYTASFSDKNAGQRKAVTASDLSLTGADSGNYVLKTTTLQTTANIAPRPVVLSGSKAADGSASLSAAGLTVMNAVAGDSVSVSGTASLASAAAGVQAIRNLTALTLNNPNYTVVGSVGSVVVGGGNLTGGQVVSGNATIDPEGKTTTI